MDNATIFRWQQGGDLYAQVQQQYGTAAADAVAQAAQTGDRVAVAQALTTAKYGAPLDTSVTDILANQLATDPLAAPAADLNSLIQNSFLSVLKNPWVIGTIVVMLFIWMGGLSLLRGAFSKN